MKQLRKIITSGKSHQSSEQLDDSHPLSQTLPNLPDHKKYLVYCLWRFSDDGKKFAFLTCMSADTCISVWGNTPHFGPHFVLANSSLWPSSYQGKIQATSQAKKENFIPHRDYLLSIRYTKLKKKQEGSLIRQQSESSIKDLGL